MLTQARELRYCSGTRPVGGALDYWHEARGEMST